MAERVVDLLEAVEVHDQHGQEASSRRARRIACWMRSRKKHAVGKARQRVVESLVLVALRLLRTASSAFLRPEMSSIIANPYAGVPSACRASFGGDLGPDGGPVLAAKPRFPR